MVFKQILKQLRTENKLSQGELALKLNASLKTVSHWETGYSEPSISQLIELSRIFEVSVGYLLGIED